MRDVVPFRRVLGLVTGIPGVGELLLLSVPDLFLVVLSGMVRYEWYRMKIRGFWLYSRYYADYVLYPAP